MGSGMVLEGLHLLVLGHLVLARLTKAGALGPLALFLPAASAMRRQASSSSATATRRPPTGATGAHSPPTCLQRAAGTAWCACITRPRLRACPRARSKVTWLGVVPVQRELVLLTYFNLLAIIPLRMSRPHGTRLQRGMVTARAQLTDERERRPHHPRLGHGGGLQRLVRQGGRDVRRSLLGHKPTSVAGRFAPQGGSQGAAA